MTKNINFTILFSIFICITLINCDNSKKAIELVQNSKDYGQNLTNLEKMQKEIEEGAKKNIQYIWEAKLDEKNNTWIVSFVDTIQKSGFFWEADLKNNIVKLINSNWLLKKKYNLTPLRGDRLFTLQDIEIEEVIFQNTRSNNGIVYRIKGKIKNNTEKIITNCQISANLIVIYSEQKIFDQYEHSDSKFIQPTNKDPWKPGETKDFYIITTAIDEIYKDYTPEDAFCFIYIYAEDPLGFEYKNAFVERQLKKHFSELK